MVTQLEKLEEDRKKLDARIKKLKSQDRDQERKRETRKKIVIGGYVLQEMEKDEKMHAWVMEGLDETLKRRIDRELFDLDPLPETPPEITQPTRIDES